MLYGVAVVGSTPARGMVDDTGGGGERQALGGCRLGVRKKVADRLKSGGGKSGWGGGRGRSEGGGIAGEGGRGGGDGK